MARQRSAVLPIVAGFAAGLAAAVLHFSGQHAAAFAVELLFGLLAPDGQAGLMMRPRARSRGCEAYVATDCEFNREMHPHLIGQVFQAPPEGVVVMPTGQQWPGET